MPRKRREGITTPVRYMGKMYAVGYGIFHGNEELAKLYATLLMVARNEGYGIYRTAWNECRTVLIQRDVPSALWGLYKAFTNELVHKALIKKVATVDDIIRKWTEFGLDTAVLQDIANAIIQRVVKPTPTPAEKT